ncbi:MAG: prepilin-type N-terminal cleavage/methylation domain-containing protein [Rubrivivax sp.]|nr:prepilin-type N-terminal cleavage/methylation domain-containing protein [Rubrivivax sp.]
MPHASPGMQRPQRGLSLVEMMVGVAVGLIVVAGASMLMSTQLVENRRLLVETQIQQDMRASMDIITRELRRIGVQSEALALQTLWVSGSGGVLENEYALSPTATVSGVPVTDMGFGYWQPGAGFRDWGFKLENGTVKTLLSRGGWQELTDANVLNVTAFTITPRNSTLLRLPCPKLCPDGTTGCWPQVQVREFEVAMTAQARTVPGVDRSLSSNVRLRNDHVRFDPAAAQICPP